MTQTNNRFFDEMARLMNDAAGVAQGVRREFDTLFRNQAERILRDLDVVQREEFEAVKEMARLAREENDFKKRKKYYDDSVRALLDDAPVAILLHVNEQKIHHKYVKGFQMIPAGLIDMHRVWLDRA